MIVKNEERVLSRCLDSVKNLVDEIIIVDTGSTDKTVEVARRYTDRIYYFTWIDDFSAARNYAFEKARMTYTMWLDADDILLPEDQQRFNTLKMDIAEEVDSFLMPYILGRDNMGRVTSSLKRNRIVKTSRKFTWQGAVHEYLQVYGHVKEWNVPVVHMSVKKEKTDRNLKIYEKLLRENKDLSPRDLYYYANECFEHGQFKKCTQLYREFLDTRKGWQEDCIAAIDKSAEALLQLGKTVEAEMLLFESFRYDSPRAPICCKLGYIYFSKEMYERAVYWYKAATECDMEQVKKRGALVNSAYYTWLPHIQLCVCYDRLGKRHLAYSHNEIARLYHPGHASILKNKQYFESIQSE